MKIFLVIAALIAITFADHHHYTIKTIDDIIKARNECMNEVGVSEEDKAHIKKFEYPDKPTVHSYVYCTSTKLEFFDDVNGFHLDHLVDQLGQNKDKTELTNKIKHCLDKNEQKTSVQLWAYRNYKCMLDAHVLDDMKQGILSHSH